MYYPIRGGVVNIDDDILPLISSFSWQTDKGGYAVCGTYNIKMHRLVMNFPNDDIDHINRDTLDNRKENLRTVTHRENHNNRGDHGMWPVGVSYEKRYDYFYGRIYINGKTKYLGKAVDPISLGILYKAVEQELNGDR
jgi:hypothetical protein